MYGEQRPRFSLGRFANHVLIAIILVTMAYLTYWFLLPQKTVSVERFREMGEQLVGIYLLTVIVTAGPSYLLQKGFRALGFTLVAVVVGLLAWPSISLIRSLRSGAPSVPNARQKSQPFASLPEEDRVPLETVEIEGVRRLRHPTLGFSLLHPGEDYFDERVAALNRDNELRAVAGGRDWTQSYVYTKKAGGTALIVSILNGIGVTEKQMQEVGALTEEGYVRGMRNLMGANVKVEHLKDEVVWDANRHEASRYFTVGDLHCRTRAHAIRAVDHPPFVVLLMLTSREPTELEEVLESFRSPTVETAQLQ